ncbi:MAG TPA: SDR family NAD(P)-dependent oxidoreductase, partial [Kofleriaceae bacterium]|nr:SDR family NAD(P)-dependent oxidoreductase [Kofleriaceae bacterium]
LALGPSYRPIAGAWGGRGEALTELVCPAGFASETFELHPAILDGALQSAIVAMDTGSLAEVGSLRPFTLAGLTWTGSLATARHAHARRISDEADSAQFEIELLDATGRVIARLDDYVLFKLRRARAAADHPPAAVAFYCASWRPVEPPPEPPPELLPDAVVVIGRDRAFADAVRSRIAADRRIALTIARPERAEHAVRDAAARARRLLVVDGHGLDHPAPLAWQPWQHPLWRCARSWLRAPERHQVALISMVRADDAGPHDDPAGAALVGAFRCVHDEDPGVRFTRVAMARDADPIWALRCALAMPAPVSHIHASAAGVAQRAWSRVELDASETRIAALRDRLAGGAVLITGGMGAIGWLAAHAVVRSLGAAVILMGRRAPTRELEARWAALDARGFYRAADAADERAIEGVIGEARSRFGRVVGVIHAAGIVDDGLFAHRPPARTEAVARPKVCGIDVLDRTTNGDPLEFFAAFSSASAIHGNPGQADYAYANAFLDGFVEAREVMRGRGLRAGRSLALAWPWWRDGGMPLAPAEQQAWHDRSGLAPVDGPSGQRALVEALVGGAGALLVGCGEPAAIEAQLERRGLWSPPQDHAVATAQPAPPRAAMSPVADEPRDDGRAVSREDGAAALRAALSRHVAAVIAHVVGDDIAALQDDRAFRDHGVDSLMALRILRALEKDFGSLRKTLLFEQYTLCKLVAYLIAERGREVAAKFASSLTPPVVANPPVAPPSAVAAPAFVAVPVGGSAVAIAETSLGGDPELSRALAHLRERFGREAGALARRDLAPWLFVASDRRSYIHINRRDRRLIAMQYVGPDDAFADLVADLRRHARTHDLELNLLGEVPVALLAATGLTATPFAVMQRLPDLGQFTLEGAPMQRLRNQIGKFRRGASCITGEVRPGESAETDRALAALVERWCAHKQRVNPYVQRVQRELRTATLAAEHRVFLTTRDGEPDNAIVITRMPPGDGYLMDLEFYGADAVRGGLEHTICEIIGCLVREGARSLSLGTTFGVSEGDAGAADRRVAEILGELRDAGTFDGRGNLQFKNKLRPHNTTVFLAREPDADPDSVIDVVMMIADPEPYGGPAPAAPTSERGHLLAQHGFNVHAVPAADVMWDLRTDSWAELGPPVVSPPAAVASERASELDDLLRRLFGQPHVLAVASGRLAESLVCQSWRRGDGVVPQNLLFPTFLYHQIARGLSPRALPHAAVLHGDDTERFRGGLDLERFAAVLADSSEPIAFTCVELASNAAGGYPITLTELRRIKSLAAQRGVPLVVDATRVLENAWFVAADPRDVRSLWDAASELCSVAGCVTAR